VISNKKPTTVDRILGTVLIATGIAFAFVLATHGSCRASEHPLRAPENRYTLTKEDPNPTAHIDPRLVREAFNTVVALMTEHGYEAPPKSWRPTMHVVLDRQVIITPREDGGLSRWFAFYKTTRSFDKKGRFGLTEKITLHLKKEEDCLIPELLIHELLHSFHARLSFVNENFRGIDPEEFVDHFYTERETFPECP